MAQTKGLSWEQLEAKGFTIITDNATGRKRIDFTRPPKGKKFVPRPTDENDIKLKGTDRRFVTGNHRFSATRVTVEMELVDEETEGAGADAYVAMEKAEAKREERKRRCRYKNPRTGKETYCPDSISCYGDKCPKKQGIEVFQYEFTCYEDLAETVRSCSCSDDPVGDEAVNKVMWEEFKTSLREKTPVLAEIIEWDEYGYRSDEIILKFC